MKGLVLRTLGLWLLLGFGLRLFFLLYFPGEASPTLTDFGYGFFNDLLVYFVLCGFVACFWWFGPMAVRVAFICILALVVVVAIAEVFFWFEFESRLDRLVFHYLAYPKEVVVFLEEQFYVSLFLIPFGLIVWGLTKLVGIPAPEFGTSPWAVAWISAGVLVVAAGAPAGMSLSRHANAFVSNGYLGVLVDARYPVDDIAWLQSDKGGVKPGEPRPDKVLFDPQGLRKEHVILIIEESFAGPVWRDPELRQRFLPHFSDLAERGISFSRMYATGSRTTRGMEALLNGFAPLPGISTTERSEFERLPALARAMADGGFHPVFIYGGWPGFSNFSNYWRASGFRQIWTRNDFDEDFTTSWGVADQALFRRLLLEMDKLVANKEKVFVSTLTVSHHRPYDFPPGLIDLPAGERSSTYAMSYADASLGWFFNVARKKPWFNDTLFIVAADHGLQSRGDPLIPVDSYRIPFVLYANGVVPRTIDRVRSTMSLPQTLVELYELDTSETFYGHSLFCDCDVPAPVEYGYHIGLVESAQLNAITRAGECVQWPKAELATETEFDSTEFAGAEVIGSMATGCSIRDEMVQVFGPAYRHFYGGNSAPDNGRN